MKINNVGLGSSNITTSTSGDGKKVQKPQSSAFSDTFGGFERDNEREQLKKRLENINEKGKFVKERMDLRDLIEYKQMITEFLEHTVRFSHRYSKETKFGRDGSYKVMGIVKRVNEELENLTQELMKSEKDKLNIVEKISGIQGLLLDMIM